MSGSTTITSSGRGFLPIGVSLFQPRSNHTATLLSNGKVLFAGGETPGGLTATAELYDPATRTIISTGNMTSPRGGHSATLLQNGKVLIAGGGVPNSGVGPQTTSAELYDPATGIFTPTGSLHEPRTRHNALLLANGQVLIVGGERTDFAVVLTAELYDPVTGTFANTNNMPNGGQGRWFSPPALLPNGTVLRVGGFSLTGSLSSSEIFDPSTGLFSPGPSLPVGLYGATLTTLADGKVLIAGGTDDNGQTPTRIYDPASNTFINTSTLPVPMGLLAALLDNGSVLVTGGDSDTFRLGELFDPAAKAYLGAGSMNVRRVFATATKLLDGTVLMAGGNDTDGSLEAYGLSLPTPTTLQISPATTTITTGGTRAFSVVDDQGRTRFDATWSVSDTTITSLGFSNGVPTLHALIPGQVMLTADIDGVEAHATITVAPQSLRITPTMVTMLVGQKRQFSVVDELGRPSPIATWTVSDPALADITTDSTPMVTALAAGQFTLTATVEGVSIQTQVTVSADAAYAVGTVVWAIPTITGFAPAGLVQSVAGGTEDMPSSFAIQSSTDGTQSIIQALTADGRLLWERRTRKIVGKAVPDSAGGLIITQTCDADNPMSLTDVDATGATVFDIGLAAATPVGTCPNEAPKMALRFDGAVVVAAPANTLPSLMLLGGSAGTLVPTIPTSTLTDSTGTNIQVPATMGTPIVDFDGTTYVEYAVRQVPFPATSVASQLYLLKIGMDGTTNTIPLGDSADSNLFPGSLMPDGHGSVLATWTIVPPSPPGVPQPYQAALVSADGTIASTYAMPNAPTTIQNGADGLPITPKLVLAADGSNTAFAAYDTNVTSFNLLTGAASWNYEAGQTIDSVAYANGGGLTLVDTASNQINIDATGTLSSSLAFASVTFLQATWTGDWQGAIAGSGLSIATISAPPMDYGDSLWVSATGFPSQTNAATESSWFPPLANAPPGAPAGSIGPRDAIYNGLHDLVNQLTTNPQVAGRAQTAIFTPLGTTTAAFLSYLANTPLLLRRGTVDILLQSVVPRCVGHPKVVVLREHVLARGDEWRDGERSVLGGFEAAGPDRRKGQSLDRFAADVYSPERDCVQCRQLREEHWQRKPHLSRSAPWAHTHERS